MPMSGEAEHVMETEDIDTRTHIIRILFTRAVPEKLSRVRKPRKSLNDNENQNKQRMTAREDHE